MATPVEIDARPTPVEIDARPTPAASDAESTESPTLAVTSIVSPTPVSTQHPAVTTTSSLASPTPIPSSTPTPLPTRTQSPITPASSETPSDLYIVYVERNPTGLDDPDPIAEMEKEHIIINNRGSGDQDMSGWTLNNNRLDTYQFPANFILRSGAIVQVWTRSGVDSEVELYWGSEEEIWDNEEGVAYLRDHTETLIDIFDW